MIGTVAVGTIVIIVMVIGVLVPLVGCILCCIKQHRREKKRREDAYYARTASHKAQARHGWWETSVYIPLERSADGICSRAVIYCTCRYIGLDGGMGFSEIFGMKGREAVHNRY